MRYIFSLILFLSLFACHKKQNENSGIEPDSGNNELSEILEVIETDSGHLMNNDNRSIIGIDTEQVDTIPCNIQILVSVNKNFESLSKIEIDSLLMTFSQSCSNNIEFSEFSNELLFETIERYPVLTLELLKDSVKYDFEVIYQELTSPLHDLIPLSKIAE